MRKTVLVLLTVLMTASACASNDSAELGPVVEPPPLQLVHVDEPPTPTTTFTNPVVGPGGPQERSDLQDRNGVLEPLVTYPTIYPIGDPITESRPVALGLMLCGTDRAPADFTGDGEPDSCLVATQLPAGTQLLDDPVVVWAVPGVCPTSELFIDALATGLDDGCRPAFCSYGWGFDGYCIQLFTYQTEPGAPAPFVYAPPLSDPPPALSAERALMVSEDFARVSIYLSDGQVGCRAFAGAVTNRCVLDALDGLQLCFGWVTARSSLGWEPCPRQVEYDDDTGRFTETITDNNPMFHLRHNILYGHVRAGVCATDDCVWAALNNPDSQTPRCEDFWRSNPHLTPEATGYVCTPPDGCVHWYAMTYDRCMLDGALWCHHTSGLWRVCARQSTAVQPSGVPCPPTAAADWVNRGREMTLAFSSVSSDQIVLTPGVWEFTLCLRGNHHQGAHSLEYPDLFGSDNVGFEVHGPWRFDFSARTATHATTAGPSPRTIPIPAPATAATRLKSGGRTCSVLCLPTTGTITG